MSRRLPLHFACGAYNPNLSSIQALYDAYPVSNEDGDTTPSWFCTLREENTIIVDFLETQLVLCSTGEQWYDSHDYTWWWCALKDNVPLGSIKLLARANPATMQVSDQKRVYSLQETYFLTSTLLSVGYGYLSIVFEGVSVFWVENRKHKMIWRWFIGIRNTLAYYTHYIVQRKQNETIPMSSHQNQSCLCRQAWEGLECSLPNRL